MHPLRRLSPLLVLLASCAPAARGPAPVTVPREASPLPTPPAPAPLDPVLSGLLRSPSAAHEIACDLSDRVGPRLAGSAGDARAVRWAIEEMKRLGLANVRREPVEVRRWERGSASATLLADGHEIPLAAAALGGSVSTPKGGIEAPVIRVGSIDELRALPSEAVAGKIVFYDRPMVRGRDAFASYGEAVSVRSVGAVEAARRGAVASVIRSVGTSSARFPHTGGMRYDDAVRRIPAAALAIPDAETLARRMAAGPVKLRLLLETRDGGTATSANVIGEVVGSERPEEIVVIGAHLDSWDLGRGAVDDGAGVGLALDVARLLKGSPPRRTVRVVLFANEENGLKGAIEYARAHAGELARHQAALELDAGAGRAFGLRWRAGPSGAALFDALGRTLSPLGIESTSFDDEAGGADTIPLQHAGVPTLELVQDGTRYFDLHHTADDTCDKIDPNELSQVRDAALIATWTLANAPDLLERAKADAGP